MKAGLIAMFIAGVVAAGCGGNGVAIERAVRSKAEAWLPIKSLISQPPMALT
jgi:hypothetical protein